MERRSFVAVVDKYFSIRGEMESIPEAIDFREWIAKFNSSSVNKRLRQWSGKEKRAFVERVVEDSNSDGT